MTTIKTSKLNILVQQHVPANHDYWYAEHRSEKIFVNFRASTIEHTFDTYVYSHPGEQGRTYGEVTRKYYVRRAKEFGDWMRRETNQVTGDEMKTIGYNPCPSWISDVLNSITEYFVIKTIVE